MVCCFDVAALFLPHIPSQQQQLASETKHMQNSYSEKAQFKVIVRGLSGEIVYGPQVSDTFNVADVKQLILAKKNIQGTCIKLIDRDRELLDHEECSFTDRMGCLVELTCIVTSMLNATFCALCWGMQYWEAFSMQANYTITINVFPDDSSFNRSLVLQWGNGEIMLHRETGLKLLTVLDERRDGEVAYTDALEPQPEAAQRFRDLLESAHEAIYFEKNGVLEAVVAGHRVSALIYENVEHAKM